MPPKQVTAKTLRAQLHVLLFLKGDEYKATTEIAAHAKEIGIAVDYRTIQRWLNTMCDERLIERKGGLYTRQHARWEEHEQPSREWGWRWHRDSIMRPLTDEQ